MKKLFIIMMVLGLGGCSKKEKAEIAVIDKAGVVAEINGAPITLEAFNQRYQWYVDRFKFRISRKEFLENLINLEIAAQEAKRQGIDRDDKVFYDYKVLLSQHFLDREVYSKFKDIELSERELKAFFETSPSIRASHILFKVAQDADAKTEAGVKEKALNILKMVKAGKDFADLSRKYSEGPSAKNGGDLDFFTREAMVKEFTDATFALQKVGDTSDLVRTQYGFHIIKLTGRKQYKDEDQRRLKSQLRSKKQKEIYDDFFAKLRGKADIKMNEKLVEE